MIILKIVAAFILLLIAWYVLWHVLGWLSLLVYTAVMLLIAAAVAYGVFMLFFRGKKAPKKTAQNYKLAGPAPQIYVFRAEPSVKDLVYLHDELHVTKLELAGDVFPVEKDTHVIILEDTGKESVKIRVKGSKKKQHMEGWIDRSSLVLETKQITG